MGESSVTGGGQKELKVHNQMGDTQSWKLRVTGNWSRSFARKKTATVKGTRGERLG